MAQLSILDFLKINATLVMKMYQKPTNKCGFFDVVQLNL